MFLNTLNLRDIQTRGNMAKYSNLSKFTQKSGCKMLKEVSITPKMLSWVVQQALTNAVIIKVCVYK